MQKVLVIDTDLGSAHAVERVLCEQDVTICADPALARGSFDVVVCDDTFAADALAATRAMCEPPLFVVMSSGAGAIEGVDVVLHKPLVSGELHILVELLSLSRSRAKTRKMRRIA